MADTHRITHTSYINADNALITKNSVIYSSIGKYINSIIDDTQTQWNNSYSAFVKALADQNTKINSSSTTES